MNNELKIPVRVYPVATRDERTGTLEMDHLILTKQQLQAAQIVGQSVTDLILRIFNRQGYKVLDIGKPVKKEVAVDLYAHKGTIIAEGEELFDPSYGEGDNVD